MAGGNDTVAVTVVVAPVRHVQHPVPHQPSHLASTGAPIDAMTAIATTAIVAGTVLLTAFRRRTSRLTSWGTS
jgi:hypothetical protein